MSEIILKVTSRSLQYVKNQHKWGNAQIAINSPKFEANREKTVDIIVADVIRLTIGDNHAIWYTHNNTESKEDFKKLFLLLANHPDKNFRFDYKVL